MKCLLMLLLCLLSTGVLMAQDVKPARIHGQIKDFKGGLVTVIYYANYETDTISVDANGTFEYSKVVKEPGRAMMAFENYKAGIDLFIENGMKAELVISFIKGEDESMVTYEPVVDYQGDNADCTAFMNAYMDWSLFESPWSFERLDTITFAEYRETYLEDMDAQKAKLMKVESMAFRRMMAEEMDASIPLKLFRYAWAEPREDADLERWVESFDRNDPANMDLASRYVRWYEIWHPKTDTESYGTYYP